MMRQGLATISKYCPLCGKRPERPENQDPSNLKVSVPEICPSCKAINGQLLAEAIAAGKVKVRVCAPGESARPKADHQKSLLNLTGRHSPHANRSKNQPP